MNENPLLKLTGLWEKTSAKGNRYLTGRLNANVKIVILQNTRKSEDSDPDYHLFIQQDERKPEGSRYTPRERPPREQPSQPVDAYGKLSGKPSPPSPPQQLTPFDDEIPF